MNDARPLNGLMYAGVVIGRVVGVDDPYCCQHAICAVHLAVLRPPRPEEVW